MIISASRRTDIAAFYSEWFVRRLREGIVHVPYPRTPGKIGSIRLSPDNVDCIVLWTKNARPMLDKLSEMDAMGYRYYFSYTITPYGSDIEPNVPPVDESADTFLRVADRLGPARVDWRYDPILLDDAHTADWHAERFSELCKRLRGATERCIINFVKEYRHLGGRVRAANEDGRLEVAASLAAIAAEHGIALYNCSDSALLAPLGIRQSACIDKEKIERIAGYPLRAKKDPGQPKECHCIESLDVGIYDTCMHGCVYCYANVSAGRRERLLDSHDPSSPLLAGEYSGSQQMIDRTRGTLAAPKKRDGETR